MAIAGKGKQGGTKLHVGVGANCEQRHEAQRQRRLLVVVLRFAVCYVLCTIVCICSAVLLGMWLWIWMYVLWTCYMALCPPDMDNFILKLKLKPRQRQCQYPC